MIGRVKFTEGGIEIEAILGDDGRWTCEGAPHVAELLNRACPAVGDPDADTWGHEPLVTAAQLLHGLAELGPGRAAN